ncbi:MAG: biotin/lipoyl-binding protein, partial [Candidatus Paceibacterota bacterium]
MSKIISILTKRPKLYGLVVVIVIIIAVVAYWNFGKNNNSEQLLVMKPADFVQTVAVAGKVTPAKSVDLGFNRSGKVAQVNVVVGQKVEAGQVIAQLDLSSAVLDLENSRATLSKLQEPADKLSLVQAQNALASALNAETKAYSDGFNAVDTTFLDLPDIMTGLDNLFNNYNASTYFTHDWALSDAAKADRQKALA